MLCDRRAKIVATIGPATDNREALKNAIKAGMNVARLNFSHGTHEAHLQVIKMIRELAHELHAPVAILQDLQGPKIRVGHFADGSIDLREGQRVKIEVTEEPGHDDIIPTDFVQLPQVCKPGTKILLDDGLITLRVDKVVDRQVYCAVVEGGKLKDRKGMNVPGTFLPVEPLTPKDLDDLQFGLAQEVDYVALSFVRHPEDVKKLRDIVNRTNPNVKVVSKIEMFEATKHLKEIISLSDAVMVARGDLAVEVGQTYLPGLQKRIISLANKLGRPVITATQMLESMVEHTRPTRAEITDVANAVLDGSDALMLSAETASGHNPFKAISTMHEIICEVEKHLENYYRLSLKGEFFSMEQAIGASACLCALKLNAAAICCLTSSGRTANQIAAFRPRARIVAVTPEKKALNKMEMVWGIQTFSICSFEKPDQVVDELEKLLKRTGLVKEGDKIVITLGLPQLGQGRTNSLMVHTIGSSEVELLHGDDMPLRCQC